MKNWKYAFNNVNQSNFYFLIFNNYGGIKIYDKL